MKRLRTLIVLMAALLPFVAHAQVYVSDYTFSTYPGYFSSIASTGTEITSQLAYDESQPIALPFTFPFGQESVPTVMVSPNGQIIIDSYDPYSGDYYPHTDYVSVISPLGYDFVVDSTSGTEHVYYELQGATPNQVLVIEYNHVQSLHSGTNTNTYTFQVWLYESGDIDFVYDTFNISTSVSPYVFMREEGVGASLLFLCGCVLVCVHLSPPAGCSLFCES